MQKKAIIFLAILSCGLIFSQTKVTIYGDILSSNKINDTLIFTPLEFVNDSFSNDKILESPVINNKFYLDVEVNYPKMYLVNLNSEKNNGKFRINCFFLDNSTTKISFDTDYLIKQSNGKTNKEYLERFLPYIYENEKKSYHFYDFNKKLDERLCNYIQMNRNSFVALWFLIGRFNIEGYKSLYEKALHSFSNEVKKSKLWQNVNDEFLSMSIKIDHKFPEVSLKNVELNSEKLQIPEAEYTLIDFWFSRCRPCLEELPKWIDLYQRYNSNGFNVISISTDKTENVESYWKGRIVEKKIPWKNYLDENAVFASKEKINTFPTNYLLNEKGEVIRKNISPEELEILLINSYKIKMYFDNYDKQSQIPVSIFKTN